MSTKKVLTAAEAFSMTTSRYSIRDRVLPELSPKPPGKPRAAYGKPVKFPELSDKDLEWIPSPAAKQVARDTYARAVLAMSIAFCTLQKLDASLLLGFAVASLESRNEFLNAFIIDVLKRKLRAWLNDNYRAGLFLAVGVARYHPDFARGKASNIFVKNRLLFKGNLTRYLGR
jgi:hypothetical protein